MPTLDKALSALISLSFMKTEKSHSTAALPLLARSRGACGSYFSACHALLLSAALLPGLLLAAPSASQQIDQAVTQHLTAVISAEAAKQGWQGMRFSHASSPLNSSAQLPACRQPLQVSSDSTSLLARQRLTVQCHDQPGWSVVVSSQASIFLPAVFARQTIERGQTISAEQLRLQELDIGKAPRGFFNRLDQVVGMGAKRRIRANQALSPNVLATPLLVRRGQQVKIFANHDGISASTLGEALESGGLDAVIRVKNLSSGKTIDSKVLEAGVVTSTFR
jgi:flagella basal body P-ring formation protein FlgA